MGVECRKKACIVIDRDTLYLRKPARIGCKMKNGNQTHTF